MVVEEHFDVIVVGSGFGGSVTAMRLAEAGWDVLVLERGQPYPPGSFARTPYEMRTNFWSPESGSFGLFELWSFDSLDVVVSSGLGGGSLIYANVMLRKDERTFVQEDLGDGGYESWPVTRADLDPHYDQFERVQQPQPFPVQAGEPYSTTPKTRAMHDAAASMGLACELPPLAVVFAADGETPAPGRPIPGGERNLHGAPRSTCRLCGECDIGCNYGSKSTLDLTCLSEAARRGAQLRTCCEVRTIAPARGQGAHGGGYLVGYVQHLAAREGHPEHLLDDSEQERRTVSARHVVLAAGAIGSPRLLLANRAALPRLSSALGARISANGDCLALARDCRTSGEGGASGWRYLEPSRGPVITSSLHVEQERSPCGRDYYLQDAGAPAFAEWLWHELELPADVWRVERGSARRLLERVRGWRDSEQLDTAAAGLFGDAHSSAAMMPLLAMGRDIPNGQLRLEGERLELDWSAKPSRDYYDCVRASLAELTRALDGHLVEDPLDRRARAVTVHPVGGCAMAVDPRLGVVDTWGQVHGYPGLWVADGSVMPGPVGPNPSFTIAALADRFADAMIEGR